MNTRGSEMPTCIHFHTNDLANWLVKTYVCAVALFSDLKTLLPLRLFYQLYVYSMPYLMYVVNLLRTSPGTLAMWSVRQPFLWNRNYNKSRHYCFSDCILISRLLSLTLSDRFSVGSTLFWRQKINIFCLEPLAIYIFFFQQLAK